MTDLVIVNPSAAHGIYGPLGDDLIAVEPPQWCRIIAAYVRDRGFSVKIIDAEAERLEAIATAELFGEEKRTIGDLVKLSPKLICIAAYGHQPSASTQQMWGAGALARELKKRTRVPIV